MISRKPHLALKIARECFIIEGILKRIGEQQERNQTGQRGAVELSPVDQVYDRFPELERLAFFYTLAAHKSLPQLVMQPVDSCIAARDSDGAFKIYKKSVVNLVRRLDKWVKIDEGKRVAALKKFYGDAVGADRLARKNDLVMYSFAERSLEFVDYLFPRTG